jgi:Txe/YoeB family toxin of toxin-antitoxin system
MWKLVFTKQAQKDALKISESGLKSKVEILLNLIIIDPYSSPPLFEKLKGDLSGLISRRINIQHRLIYQVYHLEKKVKIIRMWTHYE